MIDPSALSDEKQPSFRIDRQGGDGPDGSPMGPAVPDAASQFQADVALAEQGDPDAAQRVLSSVSGMTMPVRERADLRRRIRPGLQAGLMRQADKAPIEPERTKPSWVGNKMSDLSILRLQDTIGFAEGGIHNSGRFMSPTERAFSEDKQSVGKAAEMLWMRLFDPDELQEAAAFLAPGFAFKDALGAEADDKNALAYVNPMAWARAFDKAQELPDQATLVRRLQGQTAVARNDLRYVDEVIIPNLIDAWDTGRYTPAQLRDAVRRTGLRPDNALGRRIDNMRYQRHISAKPEGVDGSQWRARFKPLAPNFKTEAEALRDSAAQMGEVGLVEELPSAALGMLGMFGDVAENLTLSGLQDDYKQLAQLIRDGKPVPEDLADRVVAFELQEARPRTKTAKHVGEFADSFGYVLDMYVGDKLLSKIPGLDKLAKKFPKSIGQVARGFGMTDDALIAAAKEASPLWRNVGNKIMGVRTEIALGGARGAAVTGSVARGLGQAAAATTASTALQAGASLADRGDLSITRVGMPGMTALERSMREEVMVGINPDTMQPTFNVSETAVSDSPTAADFFGTATEFVSEHLGRHLPLVGSDMTPNARRRALANAMGGTMGAATRNRFVRALSGASDAVPIGGIFEEHAEEVLKRGLDKFAGVLTGNEQLSETEVLGGMAEMVDEFERVALNTSLMRAGRATKDRLNQRRSTRQRAKLVDGLIRDVQNMDNDPEAAARVQKYLDRSRTPDPEVIGEVVAGIEGADFVDLETLSDEARSTLNHFASTYGVTIVPMQGAVSEEGLFSDKTPGVIYLSVDTLNDEGKLSEATPKILQEVAMHELEHDAQFLLGDLWGPLAEGMKAKHPEVWEAATKRYQARTPGFDQLSPEVQAEEAASQIAQDNAILVDALLNDPQVGRLLAEMDAGGEMSPMERIQHGLRRLVTFDLSGRRSRDRAARVLREKIGFEGTSAEAAAAYDISEMLRDVMAIRGAVRINQSLGRHAGILGVSDNEYVDPSPEIMRRLELERQRMGAPLSEIPVGGLYMPANLYPALDQQAPAQDFDVQPFDDMRQEATERAAARVAAENEREATASAQAVPQLDTEVARAEEVYNQRVEAAEQEYSRDQEGRTPGQEQRAVERYDQQVLEATNEYNAEVDAINERRDEAQRVIEREAQSRRDSDPEIGALAAEFANIQEQEDQARAEAPRPIPQRPDFIPFGESVLEPAQPAEAAPQPTQALPTAEDTAQLLEQDTPEGAEARAERDAQQEAQRERTDAAARGEAELQRNIQGVLPGDRIRIRQSSPAYDPTIGRLQQQEGGFEVLEVTGPEGQQRIRIQVPGESMSTVIPADQVRKLRGEQTMPTTEGTREAIDRTREDARTGRVRFSPRTKGLRRGGRERAFQGPRQEFVLSSVTARATPKRRLYDTFEEHRVVGMDGLKNNPAMKKHYDRQVQEARRILGQRGAAMDDAAALRAAEKFIINNLLHLYDNYEAYRDRAKKWYDGANVIAKKLAADMGIQDFQAAGTIAVLSPQRDWDQNVHLARLITRGTRQAAGTQATPEMIGWMQQWDIDQSEDSLKKMLKKAKTEEARAKAQRLYKAKLAAHQAMTQAIRDAESFDDLPMPEQGKFVRALIEVDASYDKNYRLQTPEGEDSVYAVTKDGARQKVGWPGNATIGKAVRAMDATIEELDVLVGDAHKVRSFYNNIMYPNGDWGDTTIDTHAVAAGMLMPYSGNSQPVKDVFSSANSSITGINGTYPLYSTAYRRAAALRDFLGREMQSVTWEAARGLFVPEVKNEESEAAAEAIWDDWRNGKISQSAAQRRIFALYDGINPPRWAASDDADAAGARDAEGEPGRSADASGRGVRRSPRAGVPSQSSAGVPEDSGQAGRRDGADANGVVPVITGAERNKNFQKFIRRTKVRGKDGKPLVLYHGTRAPGDFSKFDRTSDIGYHFGTLDQAQSERFVGYNAQQGEPAADYYEAEGSRNARVYPVYLDIRNPLIMPDLGLWPADQIVNVLKNLSGPAARDWATQYAGAFEAGGEGIREQTVKAFKPVPESVVEDIINDLDLFDGNNWEQPNQARQLRVRYNEIIRKHLQNAGYDGIVYVNEAEGDYERPSYIAFSPHQVKSVYNKGTFDATDPDIRRSPRPRPMNPVDSFDLPEMTGFERFRSNYEDRFLRVQQFEQWLKSTHGVEVHGDQSPASLMKRYPGRLRARHQDITDNFETPLLKVMADNDLSVERVEQFLMAKHTEEANESLAERRRLAPVLRDEALAARQEARSLTGADRQKKLQEAKFKEARAERLDNPEGAVSYYTNERAAEILREMEASPDFAALEEVAQIVYNMNEQTRDMLREGGLISQAQRDDWRRFDFYVPMRSHEVHNTWAETRGFQDAKPVSYVRKGRSEEGSVPNPLIFSFQQARSAINRAHKNIIGNRLVKLVEDAQQGEVMPADISGPRPDFNAPENLASFSFKRDGEQMMVKFKDVDLALAIKGMDMPELAAWEERWQQATRAVADFNTQYTPEFFVSNYIRDAIGAAVMAGEFRDEGYDIKRRRIAADTFGFLKAQVKPGSNTDFDAVIREYKDAGGQIGWSDATDFGTIQSDITKKLGRLTASRTSRGVRKMLYAYPEFMSKWNLAMEQSTRLAVFRSMRLAGATPAQAAEAARDITVDFNRRGHKSGFLNRAYMFFNAGVQGNARAARAFLRSKEVKAAAGGGVVLGFFMDMFMAAGSDEDEDGRLEWDNTDSYTRYNHLHVPGSNVKVPLPYGWNLFPALGQALSRVHRGVLKPEQVYGELGRLVFDTLSPVSIPEFTPEGLAVGLTPSVPRPLAEIVANLDYRGIPIYSEPFPGTLDLDSKQDQDSAYAGITTAIYELTGGKPAEAPGAVFPIDINPNAMGHVIEGIFGGTLRFAEKLLQADDWADTDKRPIVRRVYKRPNPYGVQSNFFDLREESNLKVNALKLAQEEGDTEEVRRINSEYGSYIAVNDDLQRAYEEAKPLLEAASQAEDFATREVYRKKADQVMGQPIRRFDRLERTKQL